MAHVDAGPSERAVALARTWLVISGFVMVAFGIGIAVSLIGVERGWGVALVALGIADLIAARYASGRVAVVFSLFWP